MANFRRLSDEGWKGEGAAEKLCKHLCLCDRDASIGFPLVDGAMESSWSS